MGENIRWLLSHIDEPFQDNLSSVPLAALAILFLVFLLRQSRSGAPTPWKPLAWSLLIAPASLLLSLLLAPLGDNAGSAAGVLGLGLVGGLLLAQLGFSVAVVVRNSGSRLVLSSGLLFAWWLTLTVAILELGLLTGFGRTWM